jgi:hypothetical protein
LGVPFGKELSNLGSIESKGRMSRPFMNIGIASKAGEITIGKTKKIKRMHKIDTKKEKLKNLIDQLDKRRKKLKWRE